MVKQRYLFSPRKRRKDNKSMFFSKEHRDLKLQLPLLLPLPPPFSCICNCSWRHKWVHSPPKKPHSRQGRTFQLQSSAGSPTKTRHWAEIILERFNFSVG